MKQKSIYFITLPLTIGILTLVAWWLDINITKLNRHMNPLLGLCLILASVSFYLFHKTERNKKILIIANTLAICVASVGGLKLVSLIFEIDFGIDHWLFSQSIAADTALGHINRMASNSAICLLLIGTSLLLSQSTKRGTRNITVYLSLVILIISTFSFIGFIYRVNDNSGILHYLPMAVQASIAYIFFSIALLFISEEYAFMSTISSRNTGGRIARRMIPATILIPLIWAYIRLYLFSWQYSFSVEFGVSVLTTGIMVMLLIVIWFMAKELNISDVKRRKIELQLEQQAQLFNIMPDPVLFGNRELMITNINPAGKEIFEVNDEQSKGFVFDQMFEIEIDGMSRADVQRDLWGSKGYWRGEMLMKNKNGKKVNTLATLKAIKDKDGDNTGWVGVYSDISLLKETQQRLEFALDGMVAGLWEWNIEQPDTGWLSPRYNELLGYEPNELTLSAESYKQILHPDEYNRSMKFFRERSWGKSVFELEAQYRMKDGSHRWFAVTGKTKFDSEDKPISIIGSIIDVDERRRAKQVVQQQADLINMIPDGIIYTTTDAKIISINQGAEKMFEVRCEDAIGKHLAEVISYSPVGRTLSSTIDEFEAKGFLRQEYDITTPSQNKLSVLATLKKIDNLQNGLDGVVFIFTDIGPLRMNDELRAANDYLEQLAFISAHDIKSPILTLNGLVDHMAKSQNLQPSDTEILQMQKNILSQMQQTNKGLNEILQLRKKLISKNINEGEQLPLAAIMDNIMTILKPEIEKSGANLKMDISDVSAKELPHFYLQSVFYNLLTNAIKYRDVNRPLEISFTAKMTEEKTLHFTIEDNGLGFDMSHNKAKVFGIFKRFHSHVEGTGVGLHIVKSIIESYGGTIEAASQPGKGSRFDLTFKLTNVVS